jgi:hypothetical protein
VKKAGAKEDLRKHDTMTPSLVPEFPGCEPCSSYLSAALIENAFNRTVRNDRFRPRHFLPWWPLATTRFLVTLG